MTKECRCFAGMVNFVTIFCPELQGLLKPTNDLTRKGRHFIWGEEQQKAFDEIKSRLQRPQFYTCQTGRGDYNYIQILANLPLVMYCIKFKMVNQS